jgi:hypothetical protein
MLNHVLSFIISNKLSAQKKLEEHYNGDKVLQRLVNSSKENWLDFNLIQHYKPLFSTRSKVILMKSGYCWMKQLDKDGWKWWVPPSLPYYELRGAFENSKATPTYYYFRHGKWCLVCS